MRLSKIWKPTTLVSIYPIVVTFLRHSSGKYFPPLGEYTFMWRFMSVILLFLMGSVAGKMQHLKRANWIAAVSLIISVGGVFYYLHTASKFIVPIDVQGTPDYVIRGIERNPDLDAERRKMSDHDLIEEGGPSDEYLEDIYTKSSLVRNRWMVFIPYILALGALQIVAVAWGKKEAVIPEVENEN